ncbi:MAG TPA: cation diffusion facilitator family transporter [Terriglobales bacterium]|nr:cation diffusion facilitator family transporter [Terriglobales bacterium]
MHSHAHANEHVGEHGSHGHHHHAQTILSWGAAATLAYVVLAFAAGLRAHSLALLSEAGHNLTDFLALLLSWLGVWFQSKPPTGQKTFGYHRAGVLAALVNVLSLFVITALIVIEAVARLRAPASVDTGPMVWVAAIGLAMNAAIAMSLRGSENHDVNLRAAFLHMLGDAVATGLVLVGALVIARTGWMAVDPILSLAIALLIVVSGWGVLQDTLNILLEGAPAGMRSEQVALELAGVAGVRAVHDLHIWTLGAHAHALSAHVQIEDIPPSASEQIRRALCALLAERYHIHHATLQFEHGECGGCAMAGNGHVHP